MNEKEKMPSTGSSYIFCEHWTKKSLLPNTVNVKLQYMTQSILQLTFSDEEWVNNMAVSTTVNQFYRIYNYSNL